MADRYLISATIDGSGNITFVDTEMGNALVHGNLTVGDGNSGNNRFRAVSSGAFTPTTPVSGTSVEVFYTGPGATGQILVYNRTGVAYLPLNIDASSILIRPAGTAVATATAAAWTIADTASQFFGSTTRQMLNLWGTTYGIGAQANTQYFRTAGGFAWFVNGIHSNVQNDPGAGGTLLATLSSAGRFNALTLYCSSNLGSTPSSYIQGMYLGWNISGGTGETDFINSRGGGAGGYNFYNTDGSTFLTLIASINGTGEVLASNYGTTEIAKGVIGAAVTCDCRFSAMFSATATTATACTITLTAPTKPCRVAFRLTSPAAGTVPALTMAPVPLGAVMAWPATLGKRSFFVLDWDGTQWWNTGAATTLNL